MLNTREKKGRIVTKNNYKFHPDRSKVKNGQKAKKKSVSTAQEITVKKKKMS